MAKGIDKRIRADGTTSYRVRWSDETGRHTRTFATLEDAQAHLAGVNQRKKRGTYRSPSKLTVNDLVTSYIERNRTRLASSTVYSYRQRADFHIRDSIGTVEADRLTTPMIQTWVDTFRGKLTPGSTQVTVAVLTASLAEAQRIGIIENNPATGIRLPSVRNKTLAIWNERDIRRFLGVVDHPMWRALYLVALSCGLRPGELRVLRWDDVDFARKRLHVRRTITRQEDGTDSVRDGTKRGSGRVVALSATVLDALAAWKPQTDGPYIFGGTQPLSRTTWARKHHAWCSEANVTEIHLHGLRHTCASLLMEKGVHPRVVADVLGHHGVSITLDRYSHPSESLQRTAADAMLSLLDD